MHPSPPRPLETSPAWLKAVAEMETAAKRLSEQYEPARPLTGHWTDSAIPLVPKEVEMNYVVGPLEVHLTGDPNRMVKFKEIP